MFIQFEENINYVNALYKVKAFLYYVCMNVNFTFNFVSLLLFTKQAKFIYSYVLAKTLMKHDHLKTFFF